MIYFDNAATTKPLKEVVELSNLIAEDYWFNQNSNHAAGVKALELYNSALSIIDEHLNLRGNFDLSFNYNASTSLWILVEAVLKQNRNIKKIMFSEIDHNSSKTIAKYYADKYEVIPFVLNKGNIDLNHLDSIVDENTLVLYNVVNSEIGLIQDYTNINQIIKNKNGIVIGDVVQAITKVKIDYTSFDAFVFSGHKFNAFKIGVCATKKALNYSSFKPKEKTLDIGTYNTLNAACLARALKVHATLENNMKSLNQKLRDFCKEKNYHINSPKDGSDHILNFSLNGILSENAINYLSSKDIYIAASSACSSKEPGNIGVVQHIYGREIATNSIRVSFSKFSTTNEVDELIKNLIEMEAFFK